MKTIALHILTTLLFAACAPQPSGPETISADAKPSDDFIRFNANSPDLLTKAEVTKAYSLAIAEYINANYKSDSLPDTIFVQKNTDFPEIRLPQTIQTVNISVLSMEEAENYLRSRANWIGLNISGWYDKGKTEFIIVTFTDGFKPQHNCHLHFTYRQAVSDFVLDSLTMEYAYPKQQ